VSHAMIDIETMGMPPDGVILSIGAVAFDVGTGECVGVERTGAHHPTEPAPVISAAAEFYAAIDPRSCQLRGLRFDADTVEWWFHQEQEAIDAWLKAERRSLWKALEALSTWFAAHRPKAVWANSPQFDLSILRTAYEQCGIPVPWHYRMERCLRTYLHAARMAGYPKNRRSEAVEAASLGCTKHHALHDCMRQAALAHEAWHYLQGSGDAASKVRWLLDYMREAGYLEGAGEFTFPDGDTWFPLPANEGDRG